MELQAKVRRAVSDQVSGKFQRGPKSQVLIVAHDTVLAKLIKGYLEREGYGVSVAGTLARMRAAIEVGKADLIILDVMLPDDSGWRALRWIRGHSDAPILMLTGEGETIDNVLGLELGADDYLTTPLDLRELVVRLRSIRRRAVPPRSDAERAVDGVLEFSGWVLDPTRQELTSAAGMVVHLTKLECRMLALLVRNPGRTVTRDQLMAAATGRDWEPFDRNVDVHVSNLRRKLDQDPRMPSLIRTVRGAGYMFVPSFGA